METLLNGLFLELLVSLEKVDLILQPYPLKNQPLHQLILIDQIIRIPVHNRIYLGSYFVKTLFLQKAVSYNSDSIY